jgi:hypothetical protein
MAKKYRHIKTQMIVEWGAGTSRYFSTYPDTTNTYYLPKEVVEDSAEWELIKQELVDFVGKKYFEGDAHYVAMLARDNINVLILNSLTLGPDKDGKILEKFAEYSDASEYQRIVAFLGRSYKSLITASGNPSTLLKDAIKSFHTKIKK